MKDAKRQKPERTARQLWVEIHKWVGLGVVALTLVQAATGVMLSNKEGVRRMFSPALAKVEQAETIENLDAVVAAVRERFPQGRLERLSVDEENGAILIGRVYAPDKSLSIVEIDAPKAVILSGGPISAYPDQVAERLHVSLMAGFYGQVVLLIEGLVLAGLAISGIYIWLPVRSWAQALRVRWKAPAVMLLRDLHVTPGIILAPFFFTVGATGAMMIAEDPVRVAVSAVLPVGPPLGLELAEVEAPTQPENFQASYDKLREAFPNGHIRQLRFFGGERLLGAVLVEDGYINPRAHTLAGVDRWTGELVVFSEASTRPAGDIFLEWLLPIHNGEIFGPASSLAPTIVGLGLFAIGLTGLLRWVWRQRLRARLKI